MSGSEKIVIARLRRWKLWMLAASPFVLFGWMVFEAQRRLVAYGWQSALDFSWYDFPSRWTGERVVAGAMLIVLLIIIVIWPLAVLLRRRDLIEIDGDHLWVGRCTYPMTSLVGAEPAFTLFGDSVRVRFIDGSSRRMNLTLSADRPRDVAAHLNEIATGTNP